MSLHHPFAIWLLALSAFSASAAIAGKDQDRQLHLATLASVRNSTGVIPPDPPVHPVTAMYNREAVIPPQCYTRTEGKYNPCYVCHQDSIHGRENVMDDRDLQVAYSFSDQGMTNHWKNLFEDRSQRVDAISDREILDWVRQDNYSALPERLRQAGFKGWIPDLAGLENKEKAFDELGFARDGSQWVAFNYKPMPSTFWPTNGSTDDVMIRLPAVYRENVDGNYSRDIYLANLSIVEASIKGLSSISTPPIDEQVIDADLNNDKRLTIVQKIDNVTAYVGAAANYYFEAGIFPQGTEFLHTVRYLGVNGERVGISRRMKEVRYMRKDYALPKFALAQGYREEHWNKEMGRLPGYINRGQRGLDNEMGWVIQGFIEDGEGRLRANTFEENMFCMGCHTSIGATIDKTFSFARKIDGARGWGYIDLTGMPDAPNRGESQGEIATYFERVGSSEFRNNTEIQEKFFNADGTVNRAKIAAAEDVYQLIAPSPERALQLNKAYKVIVEDQDFIFGRDATVTPPDNVYAEIDNQTTPTLPEEVTYDWDIRLDWPEEKEQ
jgi:hypothetical protein